MSDTTAGETPGGQQGQPSVRVLAQYVKDFSFENPRAPMSLQRKDSTPPINIGVNVAARALTGQDFEVTLTLDAKAGEGDEMSFQVELQYAGVMRIAGMQPDHVQPFLLIEGPRLLFPFARQIMADAVRNGGFPPLMIDPIDFVSLYRRNVERQQAAAPAATN
jgi:preprotein translocase subunit SecB